MTFGSIQNSMVVCGFRREKGCRRAMMMMMWVVGLWVWGEKVRVVSARFKKID
jgi:hypothetical protein